MGWLGNGRFPGSGRAKDISRGQAAGAAPGMTRLWNPPQRGGGKCVNLPVPASFQDADPVLAVTGGGDRWGGLAPG